MNTCETQSFYEQARKSIDEALLHLVPTFSDLPYAPLFTSARYALLSPGKRLRPLLVMATAATYGIDLETALHPACAIEMIHTYSLIHDDLPCMDDDDTRRGQPSLHKIVPEWQALLTGDYLLTYAFEVLADAPFLSTEQKLDLIRTLSNRSGAHGMIGGQMLDLFSTDRNMSWETIEQMHLGKTAALITAALEFGCIIAQACDTDREALQRTGMAVGFAFQLIDDLLDKKNCMEKPTVNAVSLLGPEKTKEKANSLLQTAKESVQSLSRDARLISDLLDQMVNRHM